MEKKEKAPVLRFKDTNGKDYPAWEQRKLTDLVSFYGGLTYKPTDVKSKGVLVLRSSNVKDGALIDADNVYVDPDVATSEKVKVGDIVMVVRNGSKALIGKHAEVKQPMADTVVGAFMAGIRSPCPSFANALLNTSEFDKEIAKNMGATINQLTGYMFKQMVFFMPGKEEQEKIGSLFSTLENTITLHQRKLEALKKLKRTLLQKMFPKKGHLKPELRFFGFTNDWEQHKLGDLGHTYGGLSGKSKQDFGHGDARFVTYMNVFSNPIGDPCMVDSIEIDDRQSRVRKGDVLFTTSSETPDEVGMSCVWPSDSENLYLNSFCFGYRPTTKINSNFLASLLRSPSVREKIIFLAQGISRYNISKNKVMEISIPLPSEEEQSQIGDFFTQLDKTITLHQRKLEIYKKLKKGLLQKMFI